MASRPKTATKEPRFALGILLITMPALKAIPDEDIRAALSRHMSGDWGEMDAEDCEANEVALKHGTRLFSAYRSAKGVKFWVITEADRSQTTVLLPEDY